MPMQLVFLTSGGFFFDSSARVYWTEELDDFLKPILKGTAENTPEVKQLLCLETVVQSNGCHASFICYRCTAGTIQLRHNLKSSHPKLAVWLDRNDHDGELFRISLGPNGQFFASSNRGYRWHGVKDEFHEDIQSMMTGGGGWEPEWVPDRALFGVEDGYLITCQGGKHLKMNKSLQTCYPQLYKELKDHFQAKDTACGYRYIAINQYTKDEWVVIWNDGKIAYKLPPRLSGIYNGIGNRLATNTGYNSSNGTSAPPRSSTPTLPSLTTSASASSLKGPISRPQTTAIPMRPSLDSFVSSLGSSPGYPLVPRPSPQSGAPYRSSVSEIMQFFDLANNAMGTLGGGGGSGGVGLFNGGSSLVQNALFPPDQVISTTTDPSSVLTALGLDPSSVLSTVGLDPGSIVAQGVAQNMGCSIM